MVARQLVSTKQKLEWCQIKAGKSWHGLHMGPPDLEFICISNKICNARTHTHTDSSTLWQKQEAPLWLRQIPKKGRTIVYGKGFGGDSVKKLELSCVPRLAKRTIREEAIPCHPWSTVGDFQQPALRTNAQWMPQRPHFFVTVPCLWNLWWVLATYSSPAPCFTLCKIFGKAARTAACRMPPLHRGHASPLFLNQHQASQVSDTWNTRSTLDSIDERLI